MVIKTSNDIAITIYGFLSLTTSRTDTQEKKHTQRQVHLRPPAASSISLETSLEGLLFPGFEPLLRLTHGDSLTAVLLQASLTQVYSEDIGSGGGWFA